MTGLALSRAGRGLVVTLSGLTLANLLELSHRLADDPRLWEQVTSPDAPYRHFGPIGGPLTAMSGDERRGRDGGWRRCRMVAAGRSWG